MEGAPTTTTIVSSPEQTRGRTGSPSVAGTSTPTAVVSPYLTATEAATYIRSTVQGVYALVKRGRLKPMPGTRKLLFTREALDNYLSGKFRR